MNDEYIKELQLNPDHEYRLIKSESKDKGRLDSDYETYEEYDSEGNLIRTFTIKDATDKYPPFSRTISYA
jgi:hypothetical protein